MVPFDCRSEDDCDLVPLLEAAAAGGPAGDALRARLEAVAAGGTAFARAHLGPHGRGCYWAQLLAAMRPLYGGDGGGALPASVLAVGTPLGVRYAHGGPQRRRRRRRRLQGQGRAQEVDDIHRR